MPLLSALSGTFINIVAILLGTALGVGLGGRLSAVTQRSLMQALALVTSYIALDMATSLGRIAGVRIPGVLLALICLALGVVLGEALRIEDRLEALGEQLRARFRGGGRFTEGFVAASLLFSIGPMVVIGGIQNGLTGDSSTFVLKSALDLIAALALAGAYGVGVGFSVLPILVMQGGISLAAALLGGSLAGSDPEALRSNAHILLLTGTGGLMIAGISWNLMLAGLGFEDRRVRVGSMLPALLLAPLALWLVQRL